MRTHKYHDIKQEHKKLEYKMNTLKLYLACRIRRRDMIKYSYLIFIATLDRIKYQINNRNLITYPIKYRIK